MPPCSTSGSHGWSTQSTGKSVVAGDVAPDVWDVAGFVSPNPGGVGPMTRAMLLSNVVEAAERSLGDGTAGAGA